MKVRFVKPERSDPTRDRGITVPYAPGKRHLARWRWYLILLVVSSPLLYFAGRLIGSSISVEAPGLIAQEQITVRTVGAGYVEEVYVKPMQAVRPGDPLVRLNDPGLAARGEQLRAELKALQSVASQSREVLLPTANLQTQIDISRQQQNQQRQRLDELQELVEQGAATEAELSSAQREEQQAAARIAELYQTMAVQQNRPRGTAPDLQARLLVVRGELQTLDDHLQRQIVRAPREGRVVDLAVSGGEQLAVGGKVAMLAPTAGDLHVETYVPPKYARYARQGLRGTVVFPDGGRRIAEITDVPEVARQIPLSHSRPFADGEVGVLVRMDFIGGEPPANISNGLPIKVRFDGDWDSMQLPERWSARLDRLFEAVHRYL